MAGDAGHPVVILYEHALLGEGIASFLRAQLGVEPRVVSTGDLEAVAAALALGPEVVIFELSKPLQQVDLAALAPGAVLIDVSTVVTLGGALSPSAGGLERILQPCAAALRTRRTQPEATESGN